MLLGILALLFGTVILATWYIQTFTDTSYGKNSRFISTTFHAHPKSDAIGFPATGVVFIFAAIVIICNELKLPNLVINSLLILTLLVILISLIWRFSPLPIPRWADARYQYMNRHGMLDENGDPLPQFELSEDGEEPADNDQGRGMP